MKIKSRSFMSFVLIFVMMFSSFGVFADIPGDPVSFPINIGITGKDFILPVGDFEYFSNSTNHHQLDRVKFTNGAPGTRFNLFKTNKIALSINEGDNHFYCYNSESTDQNGVGFYKVTHQSPYSYLSSTPVKVTDSGSLDVVSSNYTVSKFFLTKQSYTVTKTKQDVIYFVETSNVDPKESYLRKLIFDNPSEPNEASLISKFNHESDDDSTEARDFIVKDVDIEDGDNNYIYFTEITDDGDKARKLNLANDIVSDIQLESFKIQTDYVAEEDNLIFKSTTENTLTLYPDESVKLKATDIFPENTTSANLEWKLEDKTTESAITLAPTTLKDSLENTTKATLTIGASALSTDSAYLIISDTTDGSTVTPVTISVKVKAKPNAINDIGFNTDTDFNFDDTIDLKTGDTIRIPLTLAFENPGAEKPDLEKEINKIEISPKDNKHISAKIVPNKDSIDKTEKDAFLEITGKEKSSDDSFTRVTLKVEGRDAIFSPDIIITTAPNPIEKVAFAKKDSNNNDIGGIIRLEEKEEIIIPLILVGSNPNNPVTNKEDALDKIKDTVKPSDSDYISSKVTLDVNGDPIITITAKKVTIDNPDPKVTIGIKDSPVTPSGEDSPPIIVNPRVNPITKVEVETTDEAFTIEKGKSKTVYLKLTAKHGDIPITNIADEISRIKAESTDDKYISVSKPVLDTTSGKVSITITGKEATPANSKPMATVSLDDISITQSGGYSPAITVSAQVNPIARAEFDTTDKIINFKKGETKIIDLKLIGEDPQIEVTDKVNEIKKIKEGVTDSKYISVELIIDEKNNEKASLKITANEVTPNGASPMATTMIGTDEKTKSNSPIIIITEMPQPKIKIQATTSPLSIVQGKTLDFELEIEKDGKFDKVDSEIADKITWSIEGTTAEVENIKGIKTTVKGLNPGVATLVATYTFDGERTTTDEIDLTVIADEYVDHEKWPDDKTPTTVSSTKIWTIKFNQPINEDTVNSRTIFIKKRLGPDSEVLYDDTITYFGDNDKSIKIKPIIPYAPGDYFLYIENVKDSNANKLKNNVKMKFTVR